MEVLVTIIGIIGVTFGVLVYGAMTWGYVTYCFWDWFLTPVFHDIPHVTYYQCIGLFLVAGLIGRVGTKKVPKGDEKDYFLQVIIQPWAALLFGSIVHGMYY